MSNFIIGFILGFIACGVVLTLLAFMIFLRGGPLTH